MKIYKFQLRSLWSFVLKGQINNIPEVVEIMAWRRPGDKPLSQPMMFSLLMHIYASLGFKELKITLVGPLVLTNPSWYK